MELKPLGYATLECDREVRAAVVRHYVESVPWWVACVVAPCGFREWVLWDARVRFGLLVDLEGGEDCLPAGFLH